MLKIKDDVDLKELGKFGFEEDEYDIYVYSTDYGGKIAVYENKEIEITIPIIHNTYHIDYGQIDYSSQNDIIDKLFDLIQAGLVEKVVEE